MLLAAELYVCARGAMRVRCAKLQHGERQRCIFCGYRPASRPELDAQRAEGERSQTERRDSWIATT
jgi:hypothetical protein